MTFPVVGTLRWADLYPGMADPSNPAPDQRTLDEIDSPQGLEGNANANATRPSIWFIAFAVLLVILYLMHEG